MNFYVYEYRDQKNDKPFYIGKGTGNRYLTHFTACVTRRSSFYDKLLGMVMRGDEVTVSFLKSGMTETEAFEFEIEMIEKYGRLDLGTGCLCNRTAGGDSPLGNGGWITEEQRVAHAKSIEKYWQIPGSKERARKRGIARDGRPVQAYNLLTGETVLSFDCIWDVKDKGFDRRHVQKVINGKRTNHAGYGWRYTEC